jgi:hypothetical protein
MKKARLFDENSRFYIEKGTFFLRNAAVISLIFLSTSLVHVVRVYMHRIQVGGCVSLKLE